MGFLTEVFVLVFYVIILPILAAGLTLIIRSLLFLPMLYLVALFAFSAYFIMIVGYLSVFPVAMRILQHTGW
jgi:hypothetical protein